MCVNGGSCKEGRANGCKQLETGRAWYSDTISHAMASSVSTCAVHITLPWGCPAAKGNDSSHMPGDRLSHRAECWEETKEEPAAPSPDAVERKRSPPSAQELCHFCAIPTGACVGAAPVILVEVVDRTQTSTRHGEQAACVLTRALKGPVHLDTGFQSHLGEFLGKP